MIFYLWEKSHFFNVFSVFTLNDRHISCLVLGANDLHIISWSYCHPSSSLKSIKVCLSGASFYQVVVENRPLNGCMCVCMCLSLPNAWVQQEGLSFQWVRSPQYTNSKSYPASQTHLLAWSSVTLSVCVKIMFWYLLSSALDGCISITCTSWHSDYALWWWSVKISSCRWWCS